MLRRLGFSGRLMAIVLLGLLVVTSATAILTYVLNSRNGDAENWAVLPERAAAVVELLDRADSEQRKLILKAINSETVGAALVKERPTMANEPTRLPFVEWVIAQFLREVGKREVIAIVDPDGAQRQTMFKFARLRVFAREPLRVAIALKDGQWVVFETRVEISSATIGIPPGFLIGAIGALVGMASILAIAREAKPLSELAKSVTKFAADAVPAPLAPRGAPEIAALIEAVNAMQSRIAALVKGRTILLGAVSHDLKTYITRLRLRIEAIPDVDQRVRATRDIDEMTTLIDDSLAIARGGAISERREAIDVAALLEADVADRRSDKIKVMTPQRAPGEAVVSGDPTALRRLFDNLIDNAVRHGEHVLVTIKPGGGEVSVFVDDDGPGIPAGERAAVFEPFYRIEASRSRATGGSGLGLAIAKQIAEAHGGTIRIETAPQGGARLAVSVPRVSDARSRMR